jgi:hypothetical protein
MALAAVLLGSAPPRQAITAAPNATAQPQTRAECASTPDGIAPIANLKTAWAMRQPSGDVRFLFSDQTLACRDPERAPGPSSECDPSWYFAFTLAPSLQVPGVYNLNDYEVGYEDSVVMQTPASGCNSSPSCMGSGSGSAGGAKGPDGTIEIYSVSEDCVTGRILRLDTGWSSPERPDFTGAFQAMICAPGIP